MENTLSLQASWVLGGVYAHRYSAQYHHQTFVRGALLFLAATHCDRNGNDRSSTQHGLEGLLEQ